MVEMIKKGNVEYENTQLKNIQHCLLILAKELKRICEKNNIPFFMLGGTMIGAVRHKGFIPWDDDMDFGMLREDYKRFIDVCKTDLDPDKFFIQTIETDSGFGKFYMRLNLKNTHLDYDYIKNTSSQKCFFIDIFPYDKIPETKFFQKKQSLIVNLAIRLLKVKLNYALDPHTLGGKVELILKPFFTKKQLVKMYNKEVQRYNKRKTSTYVNSPNAGYGYWNEILKREWISNLKEFQFEDTTFPGTEKYDEYLTGLYGDYMQFPPEEQRVTHEFTDIDFGPYKL